ncbi:TPA: hypothetical protein ACH3X2_007490 [Trebouxia sp. C0005]
MVLLHGHLQVLVCEAHDVGRAYYSKKSIFKSFFKGCAQNAKQAVEKTKHADRDCYVAVYADFTKLLETRIIPRTGNPVWNEQHTVAVAHDCQEVLFLIKDNDRLSAEHVAEVRVKAEDLVRNDCIHGWHTLRNIKGKEMKGGGELKLKIQLIKIPDNPVYARGINAADPNSAAVEDAFFQEHEGNQVVMYQDAHCGADLEHSILPNISLSSGHVRQSSHTNALCDMWRAMETAKHIIYITNWHFNPETKNPFDESLPNIGELLKRKSEEGVRVNIMIWDEIDSGHDFLAYTRVSKMLHGGGATEYFQKTDVSVKLMPRKSAAPQGIEKIMQERWGFAHHQKTMLVDQDWHGQRYLTAYMGGLDFIYLCYDTCAHTPGGRRYEEGTMPWHDCHCAVTGPAAWDVLEAYEQQWLTLAKEYHDHLKDMHSIPGMAGPDKWALKHGGSDKDDWKVQIFRCMDSGSSNFKIDEQDPSVVLGRGLGRGKGVLIDAGLHNMYVHTIRRAKHFIYIENQFFTGSSFAWSKYTDSQSDNLVPIEIALRIVHAIEHDERFAAYLLIPLHPERPGPQRSLIMLYTWHTIIMMYKVIGEALQRKGHPDAHPSDYLNFYAIANRQKGSDPALKRNSGAEKAGAKPDKSFIHVHAKTIVQDDEYVSISSANLNQRSLDGSRDTELGMGSWQPAYTLANAQQSQDGGGTASHASAYSDSADANQNSTDSAATYTGANSIADAGGGSVGGGGYMGNSSMPNSGQRHSNGRAEGDAYGTGADGQGMDGGNLSDQSEQNGGKYESGGGHMVGHVPPVGMVTAQPPSELWGQNGGGNQPDASGLQAQGQQQSQAQGQYQGQGQGQDLRQGQGHNSGWGQGQRQPEQEGQKQGSGPGQTHGQGQTRQEDFEPKVAYPKGEVYGYRMALWLEHLGGKYDPVYGQPHSLACVKRVNYLAEQNWLQFSGKEDCDMTGHLITFPIIVDRSGAVSARTVNGQFEDIKNSVKGKKQPIPAIFLN